MRVADQRGQVRVRHAERGHRRPGKRRALGRAETQAHVQHEQQQVRVGTEVDALASGARTLAGQRRDDRDDRDDRDGQAGQGERSGRDADARQLARDPHWMRCISVSADWYASG
jgi:hypothetical protein